MNIRLNRIHVRANHGCWAEETVIGGDYIVNVSIEFNFRDAGDSDDLSKTVDYVLVKEIVYQEMAIPSKLIETVAIRIIRRLKEAFPNSDDQWVEVVKLNAPMGGQVENVSVSLYGSELDR